MLTGGFVKWYEFGEICMNSTLNMRCRNA